MRPLIVLLLLAACGPIQPYASGNNLVSQHGTARFGDALAGAAQHCASRGMGVKSLGTDTPPHGLSVSRFECVKR
jgi:hypothetical protein